MITIDRKHWYENVFAKVLQVQDLIRQPITEYPDLSSKEKDQLRQTQVFKDEIVQVLAKYQNFHLVRKFEQTLGWALVEHLRVDEQVQGFIYPDIELQDAQAFLYSWKDTSYVFGGLSRQGIDCSGFSQLYYLHVLGLILPKNSNDQRKLGKPTEFKTLKDHDLIFCRPFHHPDHHVVIFHSGQFWHSRRSGGVVCQSEEEFLKQFNVEDVRTLLMTCVPVYTKSP
ncbi:MAG TPA: NlpC/P60 family protein [Bacteriovoracaceae bacterium]|nr:NlpC/P60 family protein [Bacteriovoracaceae bacterium]